jgi:hypothetical protein
MAKVKNIIKTLEELDPEEDICILMYTKSMFNHHNDEDFTLSDEQWSGICYDFEKNDFDDIWQSIDYAVSDFAYDV